MERNSESYEKLWVRTLEEDMLSFEQLYKSLYSELYPYSLKLSDDAGIAEDAIQDTFLYIWSHKRNIGKIYAVKAYFFRAVRNNCLLLIKRRKKISSMESVEDQLNLKIEPEELKLKDYGKELKENIRLSLAVLSPRQREILYLKYYNNLEYEMISEVLEINYQSVINHVYKAIKKLRKSKILQFYQIK